MQSIVDGLKLEQRKHAVFPDTYVQSLKAAGFKLPVTGYAIITPVAIFDYLRARIHEKYPPKRVGWFGERNRVSFIDSDHYESLIEVMYMVDNGSMRRMKWLESEIRTCEMTPPTHILDSIRRERSHFTDLRIVTIVDEAIPERDPLVIGRMPNDNRRYLIDWWDTDIDPTDLIETPTITVPNVAN